MLWQDFLKMGLENQEDLGSTKTGIVCSRYV